MNSLNSILNLKKVFALLIIFSFAAISVLANDNDSVRAIRISKDESISIAAKGLSKKMQTDLASKQISVKFTKAEQYFISDSEIGLRGEGTCRIDGDANDLPINFDIKIDVNKRSADDVRYVFLNMKGEAGLTVEDVVTEKLLQKMKNDFKTENVVVAIDYVNDATLENGEKGLIGAGEVRLNGMVWKKIEFSGKNSDDIKDVSITKYQIK